MPGDYEVGRSEDGEFVLVRVMRGPITLEIALGFTKAYVDLGTQLGITRCLIDIRGTRSESGVFGKYEYAYHEAKNVGLSNEWSVALLKDRGDTTPDFLDTVMTNAGYRFRIFEEKTEAVEWLR